MNKTNLTLILLVSCFILSNYCQGKNYYVKASGTPGLPGSSWAWAATDLQATIDKASIGDVIYVAAGKYYGGFIMKEGVNVQGGYTGDINNPMERYNMSSNDNSHFSILDGEGKQRPLNQPLPFSTLTTWDGFLIQNGNPSITFRKGSLIYSQNNDNQVTGILFKYDAESKKGKMLGIVETQKQWGGYENYIENLLPLINRRSAEQNHTGFENTTIISEELKENSINFSSVDYSQEGNYAAFWCDTLSIGGYSDWYLPAPGELLEVYNADLKNLLKNIGKNMKDPSWTSAQIGNTLAWAFCFGNAYCHPALKYVTYTVSAAHEFSEPDYTNSIYSAGGGVFLSANGILKDCLITNNISSTKGGGVYVGKDGLLINCHVESNQAPEGKEIYYEIVSKTNGLNVQSFDIYPNPSKNGSELTINSPMLSLLNYQITNISGQIITTGKLNTGETLLAPSEKGVYVISIQKDTVYLSKKIIIY